MPRSARELPLPCRPDDVDAFLSTPTSGALDVMASADGDILVTGAGGKMGLHLCRLLRAACDRLGKNNTIWAASRFSTLSGREAYERAGVRTRVGDFRDEAYVTSLPECPLVFHLVGAKFGTSGNPRLLQEINVDVAASVAERFPSSRFVVFSTGCVYAYDAPESGGSRETSVLAPVGDYAQSCVGREEAFTRASRLNGTPVALIRLNYSVEFRYGVLVDIATRVLNDQPVDVTMGYVNVIWQNDALNQIVQTVPLADSPPVPINITGPDVLPVRDLAHRFGRLFGKEPRIVGREEPTAWLNNAAFAHSLFGPPAVAVDTMIEWTASWLAQGGATHNKPTGFERRDGEF